MIIVHGAMDRGASFGRVAGRLGDATVVVYDRRGYDHSLDVGPTPDFAAQVADAVEVLDGRRADVLVGHSFGGVVALATAAAVPELVGAVVVFEPPQPWSPWWPVDSMVRRTGADDTDPAELVEVFMRRVIGSRVWDRLPAVTRTRRRAEGPTLVAEMRALRAAGRPFDPDRLTMPVLVGAGSESRPHQARGAADLAASLPRGRAVVVEGSNHGIHLSHPAELADLVRQARDAGRAGASSATAGLGREPDAGAQ